MKLSELVPGRHAEGDPEIAGMTADSRFVKPGFLFAALSGEQVDGAKFIPDAEEKGAVAILARKGATANVPLIEADEPRRELAIMASRYHAGQPETVVGITGTNGKTSIARFCQQLWKMLGQKAGSLGTLGAYADGYEYKLRHTTPDPVEIHQVLSTMRTLGTTHLAMEVSSHGLTQYRADGVRFALAAFTNITRDHLDYHPDFEHYLTAKMRLFTELLPQEASAVINIDGAHSADVVAAVENAGRRTFTVGRAGEFIRLIATTPSPTGQVLEVECAKVAYSINLPLVGDFQAENALVAAGLVICSGFEAAKVIPLLQELEGAPGRMQHVVDQKCDGGVAGVYVDYAHTPDAIVTALRAIRPHAGNNRVIAIIGAGGDRDKVKRPQMGKAAADGADVVIVTDDNPRSEEPASIREQVIAGCPGALEIGDRREAIAKGIAMLTAGDILLIAGKGHETGQTIGSVTAPFNDAEVAREIVLGKG